VARTIVLTRLTARARTRHELAEALALRQVPPDVAERVLDRFTHVGLVDDAEFARTWVESRQSSRGLSRQALSVELRRKGVDVDTIAQSLEGIDDESEYAAARRLAERKMRSLRTADPKARWRQLVGHLARRGYGSAVAVGVVRDVLASSAERGQMCGEDVGTDADDEGPGSFA
jgi:regulatory protein